jgi:hypothetical protein
MGRDILVLEARLVGWKTNLVLTTSHLESGSEKFEPCSAKKRKLQYEQLLRLLLTQELPPAESIQVCGGDFNLRETEDTEVRNLLRKAGVAADDAIDAFVAAGKPAAAFCTWKRKINPSMSAPMKARYDRMIFCPGGTDFSLVKPEGMRLLGVQDVTGIDSMTNQRAGFTTPSDHMGVLCTFQMFGEREETDVLNVSESARTVTSSENKKRRSGEEERELRAEAALKRFRQVEAVRDVDVSCSSASSRESWACNACTFINSINPSIANDAIVCELCGNARSEDFLSSQSRPLSATHFSNGK